MGGQAVITVLRLGELRVSADCSDRATGVQVVMTVLRPSDER